MLALIASDNFAKRYRCPRDGGRRRIDSLAAARPSNQRTSLKIVRDTEKLDSARSACSRHNVTNKTAQDVGGNLYVVERRDKKERRNAGETRDWTTMNKRKNREREGEIRTRIRKGEGKKRKERGKKEDDTCMEIAWTGRYHVCMYIYGESHVGETRLGIVIVVCAVIGYAISRQIVANTEMRIFRVFRGGTTGNQDHSPVRGKWSINQSFRGGWTEYQPTRSRQQRFIVTAWMESCVCPDTKLIRKLCFFFLSRKCDHWQNIVFYYISYKVSFINWRKV